MSKWILFDLDGTITDSSEGIIKSVRFALDQMGHPNEPDSALRRFIGPPLHLSFMEFYGFSEADAYRAVDTYRIRYRETGVRENSLFPGMKALLQQLCTCCKLAVATSKPLVFTEMILQQHGVQDCFTHVVGANLDGTMTDKTEVMQETLRRIRAEDPAAQCIMVGDRKFDMLGAKDCGLPGVGVYFGFADPGELEAAGAQHIAHTVEALRQILLAFANE